MTEDISNFHQHLQLLLIYLLLIFRDHFLHSVSEHSFQTGAQTCMSTSH